MANETPKAVVKPEKALARAHGVVKAKAVGISIVDRAPARERTAMAVAVVVAIEGSNDDARILTKLVVRLALKSPEIRGIVMLHLRLVIAKVALRMETWKRTANGSGTTATTTTLTPRRDTTTTTTDGDLTKDGITPQTDGD